MKTEKLSRAKKSKREYVNDAQSRKLTNQLNRFFESNIEVPRIKVGKRQTLETLINEEALLFAKYLRNEREAWKPRIVNYDSALIKKIGVASLEN